MRRVFAAVGAALALALSGCVAQVPSPDASVRPLGPGELALPTWSDSRVLCAGGGLVGDDHVLRGSASDPRVAWLVEPDGARRELQWWPGTSARFTPELEIIGPSGEVIAREGSIATGVCGAPEPEAWLVSFTTPAPPEPDPRMTAEP